MPSRVGEPQRIGGSDRLPTWRLGLSDDPDPAWRRRFLQLAHDSGIFSRTRMTVDASSLIFDIEEPALQLVCERIDQWIDQANGAPTRRPRAITILVVDDDPMIWPWIRDVLEPAGYVVLYTADPMEAIRLGRDRPGEIDLLLADVVMPLMDGRRLAQRLLASRPRMKIIFMSGYEVSGLAETGWPFLAKPFGVPILMRMVADVLSQRAR